jgi:heme exporter protein A
MEVNAEQITKKFGHRTVIKNLSLSVTSGQCLAIVGANGSGKTTLMRILANLIQPTSGQVRYSIQQAIVRQERIFQHIGYIGPYLELYQDLTALENLRFFSKMKSLSEPLPRIRELLKQFGLWGREDEAVKTYSSGMKQRLKYIFALLGEPEALFVDEPRANLDEPGIRTVYAALSDYKKQRIVILATNDSDDLALADKKVAVSG